MENEGILNLVSNSAIDLKCERPIIIDFEDNSSICDCLFICHGTSTIHTKGIADNIEREMKKHKILPIGVEGYSEGMWILMDYNVVVVHIFIEEIRDLYDLEKLHSSLKQINP